MAEAKKEVMTKDKYFKKYGKEQFELGKDQVMETDFPPPKRRYRIVYESFQNSIEECYFWLINYLRYDLGFLQIDKITDVFAASEHSAFFGVAQQRVGLQQDKVTQFLATIGKMIKDLFQLVRELRIIDERLGYYKDSYDTSSKSRTSAEITLKGIWVDMVEGGSKNPASVYGLARELQFTTLPDLFYAIHPMSPRQVDEMVDALEFNRKVKEVLKRKLRQFIEWKDSTYKELQVRKTFTIKYLRQHYDVIKMYMTWVKPYLRNIRRLELEGSKADTVDLVSAFEGSMVEIEILGRYIPEGNKEYFGCVLLHFDYRTRPSLSYQQEGYQRGPIHVGETKVTWRLYAWNEEDIENYKAMKAHEDFELLSTVDSSVKAAMDALGEDMMKYLKEAGEDVGEMPGAAQKEEPPKPRLFGLLSPKKPKKPEKPKKPDKFKQDKEKSNAIKATKPLMWISYKNFKKAHGMVTW
ncbi:hypothetical protein JW707_04145 [Candidatus Woesearchaeota archaeon]|nr:hypothetical protein [Candidatus Woesearchaeota archaeon]